MKKSFSIIINLVFLGVYIVNISFDRLLIPKYTKVLIFRRYYSHQVLLNKVFNDYKELVQFLLKTIKTNKEWIQKSQRICIKYSTGNGYNIIKLNDDLSEVVYIRVLARLINQKGKLEKSSITIYLIYIIEENKKNTKKKKRNKKRIYTIEDI